MTSKFRATVWPRILRVAAGLALCLMSAGGALAAESQASSVSPATDAKAPQIAHRVVGVVLYPGFEVLDVFGPVEMWAYAPDLKVVMIAEHAGPVRSAQGVLLTADYGFADAPPLDIMMVPGGSGTHTELKNPVFLDYLRAQDQHTQLTTSVCSGSALLARAGLLKGHRATSNKLYFSLATSQDASVDWIKHARWVEDGKYITSSGVAAGTDMALSVLARIYGREQARQLARALEYLWNEDPDNDPFAIQ
jgi:putative intracellular protease/amidase